MGIVSWVSNRKRKEGDTSAAPEEELSFFDHLEELRWHLIRSLAVVTAVGIALAVNMTFLVDKVLLWPLHGDFPTNKVMCNLNEALCFDKVDVQLIAIGPYEQIMRAMVIALFGGLIVAFPYVVWELWRFVKPGLRDIEVRGVRGIVAVVSSLFLIGAAFGYFIVCPFSIGFLSTFQISADIQNQWRIGEVISTILENVLACGLIFEMPVLVYYLTKLGILSSNFMRRYRRHAVVIILIIAAIITPPDPLSQILLFIPLQLLYEISIMVARVSERRMEKDAAADRAS